MSVMGFNNVNSREVAVAVVRAWLAKMQLPKKSLSVIVAIFSVVLIGISFLLIFFVAKDFPFNSPILFGIALVNIHVLAMFVAIAASAATAQESSTISWWRMSPLSDRCLGRGLSIPVWGVVLAQAILIVPTVVVIFGKEQKSYTGTAVLACISLVTGAVLGRLFLVLCKTACRYVSTEFVSRAQFIAGCLWILYAGLSIYVVRQVLDLLMEERTMSWWAILGYPLLIVAAVEGTTLTWFWIAISVIVVLSVEVWLWSRVGLEKYDGNKVATLGLSYLSRGRLPILRLELLRFIRSPRAQVVLFTAFIMQAIYTGICWNFRSLMESTSFSSLILMTSVLAGCLPILARGLSDRRYPYAMLMGLKPLKWAFTVNINSVIVSFLTTFPFLVIWSVFALQTSQLYSGFSVILFTVTVSGVVGFIVVPGTDTGAVESFAMVVPSTITAVVIWTLQGVGLENAEQFGPVMFVAGIFLTLGPSLIEKIRWDESIFNVKNLSVKYTKIFGED